MEDVKPGWKTSEFWLTVAAQVVGMLLETMAIPMFEKGTSAWAPIALVLAGALLQLCTQYGYQRSRAAVKATATVAAPLQAAPAPPK